MITKKLSKKYPHFSKSFIETLAEINKTDDRAFNRRMDNIVKILDEGKGLSNKDAIFVMVNGFQHYQEIGLKLDAIKLALGLFK